MKPEIRKEKVEKYGSFLYCPQKATLCFGTDTDIGTCRYKECLLENPAYIKKQEEIARRRKENYEKKNKEQPCEVHTPRFQRKTDIDILKEQIERKERFARRMYKENKPRRADAVMHEVMLLQAKLKKREGGKSDR